MTAMGTSSRKKKNPTDEIRTDPGHHPVTPTPSRGVPDRSRVPEPSSEKMFWLMVAAIAAVSFAVYFNTLYNGFVYDDEAQVLLNHWIRDMKYLPEIFYKSVWGFRSANTTSSYYRPLMHVINMASYHLFGLAPWGFHLVNILFHAGNTVLVFIVTARLFGKSAAMPEEGRGETRWLSSPPFLAALLFATHPVHTEAVA